MHIRYTPECGDCGVPTDNALRQPDGVTRCRDCCPPELWQYEFVLASPPWDEWSTDDLMVLGSHLPSGEPGLHDLAAPDSWLLLWAGGLMPGRQVVNAWGYEHVATLYRGNDGLLLLGQRGHPANALGGPGSPPLVLTRDRLERGKVHEWASVYGQPRLALWVPSAGPYLYDCWPQEDDR